MGWLSRARGERPALPGKGKTRAVVRFKQFQRLVHFAAMCCVSGLILTGLPLKFSRQPAIAALTRKVADVETLIFLHRLFAVFLGIVVLSLVFYALIVSRKRKHPFLKGICGPGGLRPTAADVRQFAAMFRWFAKKAKRPDLDRWSYREKFDCWAAVITLAVLAASGAILWFPAFFAGFLSGTWFNAAMVVHGYAGLLAMGLILLIHLLNTSLGWDGFHLNAVMFTGQISENELRIGRSAQYARLTETGAIEGLIQPAASGAKLKTAKYAAVASQLLGIVLIILIVVAIIL
jgi:cytochrome b subunit of formate dehydrogenase